MCKIIEFHSAPVPVPAVEESEFVTMKVCGREMRVPVEKEDDANQGPLFVDRNYLKGTPEEIAKKRAKLKEKFDNPVFNRFALPMEQGAGEGIHFCPLCDSINVGNLCENPKCKHYWVPIPSTT